MIIWTIAPFMHRRYPMFNNMNCVNVCLGNGLLTAVDKYARKSGLRRDEVIQRLIDIAEREYSISNDGKWSITLKSNGEQTITFSIPVSASRYTLSWEDPL